MSKKDLVSEEVLQELINKLEEIVNNYCYNLEYFTPTDIEGFFDGTQQEIDYYSSLIKDDVVSKNFLHSSKQIADDIAKSILEANEYTDSLLKNISSIQLEWCATSLPTTAENNKIYILPVASGGKTVNTLNIWNNTSNNWVSIGNLEMDITQFYNKSEIDTKMDLKANKTEVVANDKIVQTLDSATNSSDTVLSTSGLQVEMDKKANEDDVIKKTDIITTIDSTSTDSEIATAKAVNDLLQTESPGNLKIPLNEDLNNLIYNRTRVWMNSQTVEIATFTNMPSGRFTECAVIFIPYENANSDYGEQIFVGNNNRIFIRNKVTTTWTAWRKVCTTGVADVPWTELTLDSGMVGNIYYQIKNGICYVNVNDLHSSTMSTNGQTIVIGLPKPASGIPWYPLISNSASHGGLLVNIDSTGKMINHAGLNNEVYFGSFSYPVAEN